MTNINLGNYDMTSYNKEGILKFGEEQILFNNFQYLVQLLNALEPITKVFKARGRPILGQFAPILKEKWVTDLMNVYDKLESTPSTFEEALQDLDKRFKKAKQA